MKRIMIADDSGMARAFIKRCLEMVMSEEAEYEEAENGKVALDKMKESRFDLLVTDLNMPEMSGAQLLKHIIASPKLHGTPSIVITSLKNPAQMDELRECGVSAILGKPLNPQELSEALGSVFEEEEPDGYGA